MKRFPTHILPLLALGLMVLSCGKESAGPADAIPQEVINKISAMGFNPDGIEKVDEGYRIERDIIITGEFLEGAHVDAEVPNAEQYRTFNVVNTGGNRTITVYIPQGGNNGFSSTYVAALDEAISRYNAQNLDLGFQRVTSSGADISFSRLSKRDERRGVLGSAGFPSSNGNPYGQIKMSGILQSTYGLGVNGIATIMAHEMGHCIGFRHTDWFDRSISCGGGTSNEGSGSVGAVNIPGTPTGANPNSDLSWMLSCTDGGNRPFTNNDQTALDWMYNGNY